MLAQGDTISVKKRDALKFARSFYANKNKVTQDAYLLIYCEIKPPKRTNRSRGGPRKNLSIRHFIRSRLSQYAKNYV